MVTANAKVFSPIERKYAPSDAQLDIFRAIWSMHNGSAKKQNIVVEAGAGSGKSTTMVQSIQFFPRYMRVGFLTFMKNAAKDLKDKVDDELSLLDSMGVAHPIASVQTIHSLGYGCLGKKLRWVRSDVKVEDGKYGRIVRTYLREHMSDEEYTKDFATGVVALLEKVFSCLVDPNDLDALAELVMTYPDQIDLEIGGKNWKLAQVAIMHAITKGQEEAEKDNIISNSDMLYLPIVMKLTPFQFDVIIVDECQDMSPLERTFAFSACKKGGQIICIGDPMQAIYIWKGAPADGMQIIEEMLDARKLYLNTCYRCGKLIVEKAQEYKPNLEAFRFNPDGIVDTVQANTVEKLIQAGDFVLCRRKAPLVDLCFKLIRRGINATVRGRNIGEEVKNFLDKIVKFYPRNFDFEKFPAHVDDYRRKQLEILNQREDENAKKIDALIDNIDTINALYDFYLEECQKYNQTAMLGGFTANIDDFFAYDKNAQVVMSTVHSAKGLEFDRVIFLEYDEQEKRAAKSQEESFVAYVGLTRAKSHLILSVAKLARQFGDMFEEEEEEPVVVESTIVEEEVPAQPQEEPVVEEPKKSTRGRKPGSKNVAPLKDRKNLTLSVEKSFDEALKATFGHKISDNIFSIMMEHCPELAANYEKIKAAKED